MNLIICTSRSGCSILCAVLNCCPEVKIIHSNLLSTEQSYEHNNINLMVITHEIYSEMNLKLLDFLNSIADIHSDLKLVWLIRNPVQCAFVYTQYLNMTPTASLDYWYTNNAILWYFFQSLSHKNKLLVQFEDLILKSNTFNNIFEFCNIKYNKQYLHYGDFDQPYINDSSFQLGCINREKLDCHNISKMPELKDVWDLYKHKPIIQQLGYSNALKE